MKRRSLKFVAALLALCLILATGTAFAESVRASGGDSYIRNAPNLSGARLSLLPEGASAEYLNQSSVDNRGVTWYYVSYRGTEGWVSSRYTTLSGGGSGSGEGGLVYAEGGVSYIRSEPNLEGIHLGLIPEGLSANYLGRSSEDERGVTWYYISYNGITGWVSSTYTRLADVEASYGSVFASDGDSYIRSDPDLSGNALALFPDGDFTEYLGISAADDRGVDWYYVSYDGIDGWVSSRYTSLSGEGSGEDFGYVYASGGDSYIRSAPNRSGVQIGLLPEGSTANYLGDSSDDERGVTWYFISHNGVTGWVSSMYTDLY